MKAAIFHGRGDVRCETIADPVITAPDQMIVAIEATSICGSDLYLYDGPFDRLVEPGTAVTGHEIVARVVDTGTDVTRFHKGDRITAPFTVSCHHCTLCRLGETAFCETMQGASYGFGSAAGNLNGSHAEAMVIHRADDNAKLIPESIHVADAITLSCNLPAAMIGVAESGLRAGETVAIVGCGPTGLMTLDMALRRSPCRVVALDRLDHRLEFATAKGAVAINVESDGWLDAAKAEAGAAGFDRVIEIVGTNESLEIALSLVRPGGTVLCLGCFAVPEIRMNPFASALRNIDVRMLSTANVATAVDRAILLLQEGKVTPREYFTHEYALGAIDTAWAAFSNKSDAIVKALIRP